MSEPFNRHSALLEKAIDACAKRYAWSAFSESPSSRVHGAELPARGKARFDALLGQDFPLELAGSTGWIGEEISPFTREPLGVRYPVLDPETALAAARRAMPAWRDAGARERTGVCLEMLARWGDPLALFVNAHATMHTAGQSYIMAFAGCGANALDRGLEALALAWRAMTEIPGEADWERGFGGPEKVRLRKRYRLMPCGPAVVVSCATFPQWNGYPAVMANLATGNPVILKPHPDAVLPVALFVQSGRAVLREAGHDPALLSLVVDSRAAPRTLELLQHRDCAIIDFTGSARFGNWIEQNCRQAQVYSETAGCNSVILESAADLPAVAKAVAHSLCQASAQMCTSVQNIYIPADGVRTPGGIVPFAAACEAIRDAVDVHIADPANAAFLCGALVNDTVTRTIQRMREVGVERGQILRDSAPYAHPDFPQARTATPLMIIVETGAHELYGEERFGPVSFLIRAGSREAALADATSLVRQRGAITSHVYSTDPAFLREAEEAYHDAGASLACNLTGMPINFAAAYSDFHVTGMTPAGTACLTDLAFVARRFRVVQCKWPATDAAVPQS
jgi:phenylacetic acid degradation protein paaN